MVDQQAPSVDGTTAAPRVIVIATRPSLRGRGPPILGPRPARRVPDPDLWAARAGFVRGRPASISGADL
ncbi:hypothetical protein C4901_05905 [Acidiferrobacter sp. SPIII_3]|nr:hypothetical protein C4901_05905 [Acidiferrobacter sp. SPIII_3]